MLRVRTLAALTAVALAVVGCSSDDSTSADSTVTTAAPTVTDASAPVDSQPTADPGPSSAQFTALIEAIDSLGYTCAPASTTKTSAEHDLCSTSTAMAVQAYHWADNATLTAEIGTEITCSVNSTLGSIMSLRADTWAVSAFSITSSTADQEPEIRSVLGSVKTLLGTGEIVDTPCS